SVRTRCTARAISARYAAALAASISCAASERRTASNAPFSPGTGAVAGAAAASSRDAASATGVAVDPLTENTDDKTAEGLGRLRRLVAFPLVEQARDVPSLRVVERHPLDEPPRLARVVVRDRRLEVLALGGRLPELAPERAEERDGGGGGGHEREVSRTRQRYRLIARSPAPRQLNDPGIRAENWSVPRKDHSALNHVAFMTGTSLFRLRRILGEVRSINGLTWTT